MYNLKLQIIICLMGFACLNAVNAEDPNDTQGYWQLPYDDLTYFETEEALKQEIELKNLAADNIDTSNNLIENEQNASDEIAIADEEPANSSLIAVQGEEAQPSVVSSQWNSPSYPSRTAPLLVGGYGIVPTPPSYQVAQPNGYAMEPSVDNEDYDYNFSYNPSSLYVSHISGRGIGYHHGYTTLGLFYTPEYLLDYNWMPFLDARAHLFDNDRWAANVGLGMRTFAACWNKIFGFNVFYDFRQDRRSFNQIGLGVEMLGCAFDFRFNGYIPVGRQTQCYNCVEYPYWDGYCAYHRECQYELGGFDAEVGKELKWCCCSNWNFYAAAGGYYFNGRRHHTLRGGKVRFDICYLDLLDFGVRVFFDNKNHVMVQSIVTFSIPFRALCGCSCSDCDMDFCNYWSRPVERNDIIVLDKLCHWTTNF